MDFNSMNMKMSAEQVAQKFGYSVTSIQTKFKRTQQAIKKKYNVEIIKCQGLDGVYYTISDDRAKTMFDEVKNELYVPLESMQMSDLACFVLIGVAATPQGVFRGTRKEFLDYIGLSHSKKNIQLLNQVLGKITNVQGSPLICKYDQDYIIIYIGRQFEKQRMITINMLRACQEIAQKYNKQAMKIIQLLKVWEAYKINEQKGVKPLTDKNLQEYIDLSIKQIGDVRKLLEREDIINTTRVGTADRCYGHDYSTTVYY